MMIVRIVGIFVEKGRSADGMIVRIMVGRLTENRLGWAVLGFDSERIASVVPFDVETGDARRRLSVSVITERVSVAGDVDVGD